MYALHRFIESTDGDGQPDLLLAAVAPGNGFAFALLICDVSRTVSPSNGELLFGILHVLLLEACIWLNGIQLIVKSVGRPSR